MFSVRFSAFPRSLGLVKERWARLPYAFETDIDGTWREGKSSLSAVDSFCRRKGYALVDAVEAQGTYTLTFGSAEDARFAQAEDVWKSHQEARWARG